jgi:transposase
MSPAIKKGNGYPREFQEEAVRYWLSSGKKANEVAVELGVSGWSLNRWRKEMESSNVPTAQLSGLSGELDNNLNALELAKENGRLRRENEALLRQREILKKAISIFSAENPSGSSR